MEGSGLEEKVEWVGNDQYGWCEAVVAAWILKHSIRSDRKPRSKRFCMLVSHDL